MCVCVCVCSCARAHVSHNSFHSGLGSGSGHMLLVCVCVCVCVSQGVPVVQAAGEAEATCAVLNATGLVDAVQSKDGDSLLFGASTVYKTLRLQGIHKGCEAALCEMQDVRKALGLKVTLPRHVFLHVH